MIGMLARVHDADTTPCTAAELDVLMRQRLLDDLLDRFPAENALELDLEGHRFLDPVKHRIPRLCRVPATPGADDAGVPGERFDLVVVPGLLDAGPGQLDLVLEWARHRLRRRGRLVVTARANGQGLRGALRRARHTGPPLLGPDQAEDLLADAGFLVEDIAGYGYLPYRRNADELLVPRLRARIEHNAVARRWDPRHAASFLVVATPR